MNTSRYAKARSHSASTTTVENASIVTTFRFADGSTQEFVRSGDALRSGTTASAEFTATVDAVIRASPLSGNPVIDFS